MASKLNQIVAVEKTVKARSRDSITKAYHALQKTEPLSGISRTYRPKNEDGDLLPEESTLVQIHVQDLIAQAEQAMIDLFDVTATKDFANCDAVANVTIDGTNVLENVPVTYLLFMEKQLIDIHTFFSKLPVLDPAFHWTYDMTTASYASAPVETTRTKKIPRNHVKAEATDKHPAQVEVFTEDVVEGFWKTVRFSGALPQQNINQYLRRTEELQLAVKEAREAANDIQAPPITVGKTVFDYILSR